MIDYVAAARKGIEKPDQKTDGSGLDDGPPLPRYHVNGFKKTRAIELWQNGMTLRDVAANVGVSHETVRAWTNGLSREGRKEGGE